MKAIAAFEIVDHGIEYSGFFRGCGVSCTDYTDVATGIGDSEKEALSAALDSLAECGWDTDNCKGLTDARANASETDVIASLRRSWMPRHWDRCGDCVQDSCDGCDYDVDPPYYYISVRVRA